MNQQVLEPVHPLFMPEDDDDPVQVSEIQISRMENGQAMFAPRVRPASELQSLEQVASEFGGGTYILIARHDHRITTRRKYVLPGKSKPLYDEGPKEEAPVVSAATVDPMQAMMGGQGGLMGLIMMMMQQMMQQQAQAAASQTQMFIAMMQGNQQSSSEEKAQARAELQANIERERISSERTMSLMREMMTARGSGGGEGFTQGAEFMRSIMVNQLEVIKQNSKDGGEFDLNGLLETITQVVQGASLLKGITGGGPLPEGIPGAVAEAAQ